MASYFRGRGHELHSLREYVPTDSARFVDWKVSARTGHMMVREYAREDERRVMLVFDPLRGPPAVKNREEPPSASSAPWDGRLHRVALQQTQLRPAIPHRSLHHAHGARQRNHLRRASRTRIVQPNESAVGGAFLDELAAQQDFFKIIVTARPQSSIPSALWSSSYFIFIDRL